MQGCISISCNAYIYCLNSWSYLQTYAFQPYFLPPLIDIILGISRIVSTRIMIRYGSICYRFKINYLSFVFLIFFSFQNLLKNYLFQVKIEILTFTNLNTFSVPTYMSFYDLNKILYYFTNFVLLIIPIYSFVLLMLLSDYLTHSVYLLTYGVLITDIYSFC